MSSRKPTHRGRIRNQQQHAEKNFAYRTIYRCVGGHLVLGNGRGATCAGTVVQGVNCNPPDIDYRINTYTATTATYCYMEKQRECVNIILC